MSRRIVATVRRALVLLLGSAMPVALLGQASATAAARAEAVDRPTGAETVTPDDVEAFELFASTYALKPYGPEGSRALHEILQLKTQECMESNGFQYIRNPYVPEVSAEYNGRAMLPPLPSEAEVRVAGYDALLFLPDAFDPPANIADAIARTEEVKAANDAIAAANPSWNVTLFGGDGDSPDERGGCIVEAGMFVDEQVGLEAEQQYQALSAGLTTAVNKGRIVATTEAGEPLTLAIEEWRACMADRGFDYPDPYAAGGTFLAAGSSGGEPGTVTLGPESEPSEEEILVALADLDCRIASGFRTALRDELVAHIEAWYDDNEGAVAELRETTETEARALVELYEEVAG